LRRKFKAEMFIARSAKYSVSHFIDCGAVARRLCASLVASSNTADEMRKIKKHECNQTWIARPRASPSHRCHVVQRGGGRGDRRIGAGGGHCDAPRRRPEGRQSFLARNLGLR